ncbi:hypothetical protein P4V63_23600 [Bacillus toyonensis]|uniref:hypothetical protein n=1 Tax=Bacillus toyonensis TaxID=155322 RepID=UPI000CD9782E|nr:hypothetical protein [Bacillus toyonensis]MEE2020905.1 hypothetical protein [Bacillus toyonensis]
MKTPLFFVYFPKNYVKKQLPKITNVYVTESISKVNTSSGLRKVVVIIHMIVLPAPNSPVNHHQFGIICIDSPFRGMSKKIQ